jgi:hypothetical protein
MLPRLQMAIIRFALGVAFSALPIPAVAESIVHLSVGGAEAIGLEFAGGSLSTDGPQNTEAYFVNLLEWYSDITTPIATFELQDVMASGPALVGGTLMMQHFTGGTFSLYHPDSTLLLSGELSGSALSGTLGATDAMFTTSAISTITGGTLDSGLDADSLVLQMHLANISDGIRVSGGALEGFMALASVDLEADLIPEPATIALLLLGGAALAFAARRRWRA